MILGKQAVDKKQEGLRGGSGQCKGMKLKLLNRSPSTNVMGRQQEDTMMQPTQQGDNTTMQITGRHYNAADRMM